MVLDLLSIAEIDRCLRALEGTGAVSQDELAYFINCVVTNDQGADYQLAIDLSAVCILERIREEKLHRWDFDPKDVDHQDQQKTLINSDWWLPDGWTRNAKQAVLEDIVGSFRWRCRRLVNDLTSEFEKARTVAEVKAIRAKALCQGVLIIKDGKLIHCHSIPNAQEVFITFMGACYRLGA